MNCQTELERLVMNTTLLSNAFIVQQYQITILKNLSTVQLSSSDPSCMPFWLEQQLEGTAVSSGIMAGDV